jgi:hypothetical protein
MFSETENLLLYFSKKEKVRPSCIAISAAVDAHAPRLLRSAGLVVMLDASWRLFSMGALA